MKDSTTTTTGGALPPKQALGAPEGVDDDAAAEEPTRRRMTYRQAARDLVGFMSLVTIDRESIDAVAVFRLLPGDIKLPVKSFGILTGTMGKAELEAAACLIVRCHHVNSFTEWQPLQMPMLADLIRDDLVTREWGRNPFWQPRPYALQDAGFVEGWIVGDPTSSGMVTSKFAEMIEDTVWDLRGRS